MSSSLTSGVTRFSPLDMQPTAFKSDGSVVTWGNSTLEGQQ
ncbi:hypothetical protein U9R62_06910 [Cylindrospermopsis raciborskii DSH]